MNHREIIRYSGEYRNVAYEITKFANPLSEYGSQFSTGVGESKFNWCHYIYLNLDKQITDKDMADKFWLEPEYDEKNRVRYNYYESIVSDIEFHGGCTYYAKESTPDDKDRKIKIGCDYQHYDDVGIEYTLDYISIKVRETIDSLLEIAPVLKWCNGCGAYYSDVTKNGCGKCQYSKDKY